jgi:hypothetical protein
MAESSKHGAPVKKPDFNLDGFDSSSSEEEDPEEDIVLPISNRDSAKRKSISIISSISEEEDEKVLQIPTRVSAKGKRRHIPKKCKSCIGTGQDKVSVVRISTVLAKREAILDALDLTEEDVTDDKLDLCTNCKAYAEEAKGIHLYNNPSNP